MTKRANLTWHLVFIHCTIQAWQLWECSWVFALCFDWIKLNRKLYECSMNGVPTLTDPLWLAHREPIHLTQGRNGMEDNSSFNTLHDAMFCFNTRPRQHCKSTGKHYNRHRNSPYWHLDTSYKLGKDKLRFGLSWGTRYYCQFLKCKANCLLVFIFHKN